MAWVRDRPAPSSDRLRFGRSEAVGSVVSEDELHSGPLGKHSWELGGMGT
jgi:hypothetical protein